MIKINNVNYMNKFVNYLLFKYNSAQYFLRLNHYQKFVIVRYSFLLKDIINNLIVKD